MEDMTVEYAATLNGVGFNTFDIFDIRTVQGYQFHIFIATSDSAAFESKPAFANTDLTVNHMTYPYAFVFNASLKPLIESTIGFDEFINHFCAEFLAHHGLISTH